MGWFRWHRRLGAVLALLALALQLGLGLGHVHLPALGHSTEAAAASAVEPDGDHGDADKDYCPSCAIRNLLAGAQPGTPPISVAPLRADAEIIAPGIETVPSGQSRTAFRSRAPPLS